jgi:hypothetical protein
LISTKKTGRATICSIFSQTRPVALPECTHFFRLSGAAVEEGTAFTFVSIFRTTTVRLEPRNATIRAAGKKEDHIRVARWSFLKQKIPIWAKILDGLRLENVDIFHVHLEYLHRHLGYFMTVGYILCSLGTFFPELVSCAKKNLATLDHMPTTYFSRCHDSACVKLFLLT